MGRALAPALCPLRSALASPHPPVQLFLGIEGFVAVDDGGELERFLPAQTEHAEHLHGLEEELLHAVLQGVVEVDQDVAAEDDVEVIERGVGDEIVLREDDVLAQRRPEDGVVVARRVVVRERARGRRR